MVERVLLKNSWIAYIILWLLIAGGHIALLILQYQLDIPEAIADGLVFNLLFAVMGIGMYFIARFSPLRLGSIAVFAAYHLVILSLSVFIWLELGMLALKNIFEGNEEYLAFLNHSVYIRAVIGILFYLALNVTFRLWKYIIESSEQSAREAALINMLRNAEINMLRSQIRPHFLFNSLNSVSALTLSNPAKAREMVIKLADFMRSSLNVSSDSMSTIGEELKTIGLYLDIEKTRFADRLNVSVKIDDDCMGHRIPSLILQPLLENAIKHGVNTLLEPSEIKVAAACNETELQLTISNEFDPDAPPAKGTGTGLENVKKRLAAIYGRYDLMNTKKTGSLFEVELLFPTIHSENRG